MSSKTAPVKEARDISHAREAATEAAERGSVARRDFVKLFGYGTAGLIMGGLTMGDGGLPELIPNAHAGSNERIPYNKKNRFHGGRPYERSFRFQKNLLYMNIGTTGSSPTRVVKRFCEDYRDIARNPQAYLFGQQVMRNSIAPGFGCDPYELVMSFNTTDGLWRIVMGIPFQSGDEVITTNMEENAGISAVNMLRDRFGVVVRTVNLPTNDAYSDEEVRRRFDAELTSRTKAILFSSPVYLTGARLPAKELCLWAAELGVISIVDGAHLPGMVALNLHDMGCDFFSGAGHKWQCGPGQTGFLYIRNGYDPRDQILERPTSDRAPFGALSETVEIPVPGYTNTNELPTYYPTNTLLYGAEQTKILAEGKRDPSHNIAAILQFVGNGSRPSQWALTEVCQMWDQWGRENIEDYVVSLAQYLRARIADIWGPQSLSLPFWETADDVVRTGLTSFNPFSPDFDYNAELSVEKSTQQSSDSAAVVAMLREEYDIVVRNNSVPHSLRSDPTQNAAPGTFSSPLRVSTHFFHSLGDVDRLIDALLEVVPRPETRRKRRPHRR